MLRVHTTTYSSSFFISNHNIFSYTDRNFVLLYFYSCFQFLKFISESFMTWCPIVSNSVQMSSKLSHTVDELSHCYLNFDQFLLKAWFPIQFFISWCRNLSIYCRIFEFLLHIRRIIQSISTIHLIYFQIYFHYK